MTINKWRTSVWAFMSVISGVLFVFAFVMGVAWVGASQSPEQGSPWQRYRLTGSSVTEVDAVSQDDAWVVGSDGLFAHWDGVDWRTVDNSKLIGASAVHTVDMVSPNQAWASSTGGRMLHYDGSGWTLDASNIVTASMFGISMVSPTDGWAAGSSGIFAHYDGSGWQQVIPGGTLTTTMNGVDMVSATDGWAVGGTTNTNGTATRIARFNGTNWQQFPSPVTNRILYDVDMLDATYGWAVGSGGTLLQWDGTQWAQFTSPSGAVTLESVSVVSRTSAWAVGSTNISTGNVWHWDGSTWTPVTMPTGGPLNTIFMLPTGEGWAAGARGIIHNYSGGQWTTQNSHWTINGFYALDFVNQDDGWAVGVLNQDPPAWGLVHWNGTTWQPMHPPAFQPTAYAVDMVASDAVWVVGTSGYIFKYNGSAWTRDTSPADAHLYAMSMVSQTDGWAVGSSGRIVHYDGSTWTNYTSNTSTNLWSIDMVRANEGWAGGTSGLMLHYQNGTWTPISPNPSTRTIEGIDMLNENEGWAVGYNGTILHYLNGVWTPETSPTTNNLLNVHMLNGYEGWAVGTAASGATSTILHYTSGEWHLVPSLSGIDLRDIYIFDRFDGMHGWAVGQAPGPILRMDATTGQTPTPLVTVTTTTTPGPCEITFTDVSPGDYFYEAVRYLYCTGVISGYGDNTFRPYNNTTRGQLSKIMVLAEGWPIDTAGGPHFSDVALSHTFYDYIETAFNRQIISGYGDGTFRPDNNVTRGQLCKIVVLAEGWNIDTTGGPHFSDVPENSTFYDYIETAFNHEIISGYGDGTFRPDNSANRGQISKIVYNAITQP